MITHTHMHDKLFSREISMISPYYSCIRQLAIFRYITSLSCIYVHVSGFCHDKTGVFVSIVYPSPLINYLCTAPSPHKIDNRSSRFGGLICLSSQICMGLIHSLYEFITFLVHFSLFNINTILCHKFTEFSFEITMT